MNLTLKDQCLVWKKENKAFQNKFMGKLHINIVNKKKRAASWNERLGVVANLADAMLYLHRKNIIFRDLKTENVGFDAINGDVKLFDFGLATHLTKDNKVTSDQYLLTENTGTRRYMAPEVYMGRPYGKPADVYSFAILLWEVMTLKVAFEGESRESHAQKVYGCSCHRPTVPLTMPQILQQLIRESWHVDPSSRPTFSHINLVLRHSQL